MNHKLSLFYGLLIWSFVFMVAMIAFPLRGNDRTFFESIMPVALTAAVVVASAKYFEQVQKKFVTVGFCLGLIWLGLNLLIDLLLFLSPTPMQMSLVDYLKDIGFTYLLIPIITTGFGFILSKRLEAS